MKISEKGLDLIAYFEGIRLKPYRCPAGLWTVGVGHLIGETLPDSWNRRFTVDEAYALLAQDIARFERGVTRYCTIDLTQHQFDALVSLAFNIGVGAIQRSTLRKKINRGDFEGAAKSILKYNRAGGRVLKGLDLRRKAEVALFQHI